MHDDAKKIIPLMTEKIQEGDIIFRLGSTQIVGGLVDFSKTIAKATESDFSHAVIVYEKRHDGVVIADIMETGITRRYIIDWYMDGTRNIVIKRLKPEYQHYLPKVIECLKKHIEEDVLYDAKFISSDNKFYCTELVDHCFNDAGCKLANRIKIKDFPKCGFLFKLGCIFGGIDLNADVVIVGNEKIGLFSSDKLYTVLDLR